MRAMNYVAKEKQAKARERGKLSVRNLILLCITPSSSFQSVTFFQLTNSTHLLLMVSYTVYIIVALSDYNLRPPLIFSIHLPQLTLCPFIYSVFFFFSMYLKNFFIQRSVNDLLYYRESKHNVTPGTIKRI